MKISKLFVGKKELWKKILKCVIAYEIANILILIPAVNRIAGSPPYLVPVGALIFNASGTAGNQIIGMILNIGMMIPPGIWCGIISYLCTVYNKACINNPTLYSNGAGVIASIGFFVCVFTIAYFRLQYPRLYLPALQGFTLPFFCLTKGIYETQFDIMTIVGNFYPILMGGALALISNLLFWPVTAAKASEESLGDTLESLKNVLLFVHQDLLKSDDSGVMTGDVTTSSQLQKLNNKLQKDILSMREARQDAKYEIVVSHFAPRSYKPLIKSIHVLSQNMLGFTLAIKREVRIILEKKVKDQLESLRKNLNDDDNTVVNNNNTFSTTTRLRRPSSSILRETPTFGQSTVLSGATLHDREYKDIDRLQSSIQPALKRFISACIQLLDQIDNRLVAHKAIPKAHPDSGFPRLNIDFSAALEEFKDTDRILQKEYIKIGNGPTEDLFLVYTVVFTLFEFGKELLTLEQHVNNLIRCDTCKHSRIFLPRVNLARWLGKTSHYSNTETATEKAVLDQRELQIQESRHPNLNRIVSEPFLEEEEGQGETMNHERELTRAISRIVTKIESNSIPQIDDDNDVAEDIHFLNNTIPLQKIPGRHRWNRALYRLSKWFQYPPTRYAIKFAITCQLLSLMAYIPGANQLYVDNHGQWGLLSAMVVFNYTVGSTAVQCMYRVIATIYGAICAYLSLLAAHRNENPYVLAVMLLIFQVPMWYFLLGSPYPRIGFIGLLTMAVITSTGYIDTTGETLFDPVWKRTVTAIFAIIVVMLVDQLVWPVWARKKLRTSLADLLLDTGTHYSKVIALVCQENTTFHRYTSAFDDCTAFQKVLNHQMQIVSQMLTLAASEPRLTKGPFPIIEYGHILEHERNILYWIQHLQKAQGLISTHFRKHMMNPMNPYRKEMAASVHLYMFTLACALRTKSSLPSTLPSAELARRTLQQKHTLRWRESFGELSDISLQSPAHRKNLEKQVFWHTYAAGTTEIIVEIEAMGEIISRLMGHHNFRATL